MNKIKNLLKLSVLLLTLTGIPSAQAIPEHKPKPHRIIFQMVSGDTLSHKALMKQLQNITSVAPTTQIEVVCHGPGLNMLTSDKSVVGSQLNTMIAKGIAFYACEFSMQERKVEKERILPGIGFVRAGIIAIVERQEQGWSYIKAGF
jgi:intracellular sulfur oxidation DsrE/DsrF family protein